MKLSDRVPMTQEAYNKRKVEIEHMENVDMPKIAEKIAEARAEGDLKENAEYHAQREAQGMLQAKINNHLPAPAGQAARTRDLGGCTINCRSSPRPNWVIPLLVGV